MIRLRKLAVLAGIIGPLLFGSVLIALTATEFDFMRSQGWVPLGMSVIWPSGLALGPYGWVMTVAFLVHGSLVGLFALGLRQTLPATTAARVAVSLLLLAGLAMMGLACDTDPTIRTTPASVHGRIHDLCFAALGLTLFPSMLLLGWAFRQCPGWRGLSSYTWLTAALAVPTFAVKGVAFYVFLAAVLAWTAIVAWKMKEMPDLSTTNVLQ